MLDIKVTKIWNVRKEVRLAIWYCPLCSLLNERFSASSVERALLILGAHMKTEHNVKPEIISIEYVDEYDIRHDV